MILRGAMPRAAGPAAVFRSARFLIDGLPMGRPRALGTSASAQPGLPSWWATVGAQTRPGQARGTGLWIRTMSTSAASSLHTECPFCGATVKCCTLLCPECKKALAASDKSACANCTHFELLGLPQTYDLDAKAVERKFKALQMELHPDKFVHASEEEKKNSAATSARLNEAFATLKSPMLRARYLLESRGVNVFGEDSKTATDMTILTEAMELREELDALNKTEEFTALAQRVGQRIRAVELELAAALGDTQQLAHAVTLAVRLRYLERILEEARSKAGD